MTTLTSVVMALLESTWSLTIEFIPLLYLGFLGYALALDRERGILEDSIRSQRDYTLYYGLYILAGLVFGGVVVMYVEGLPGMVTGGFVALSACIYSYFEKGEPDKRGLELEGLKGAISVLWLAAPVLAVAGIVSGNSLMKSLVALIFLSAIFWEV
ncbi:MAG: hypothetical protein MUP63_00770 [Candidatus Nanohaloarchaeota archaeon QJJ-7]|nr:hypothetical protein [Candidatus Nanohaloarchaeota archaeon QJJ-7]